MVFLTDDLVKKGGVASDLSSLTEMNKAAEGLVHHNELIALLSSYRVQ